MELGNAVERGAEILGVKPCEGCKRRKEMLLPGRALAELKK